MRKLLVLAALAALLVPIEASASVLLGVEGSKSRFRGQTNQATDVNLDFISWGVHKQTYLDNTLADAKPVPVLSFGTVNKYGNEAITPAKLAKGKGDRVLIDIAQALDRFGNFAYVRPYAEMNGHWNPYCAYNSTGTYRGSAHSTKKFRKAFRRADAYYPGNGYVDVVANDLYDYGRGVEWGANLDLYRAYPKKPYAIGEWGLGPGIDHPGFVQKMANFVSSHPRVEAIVYYRSQNGSTFDLAHKPNARAAYKRYILPLGN